jgi:hypothetical protein
MRWWLIPFLLAGRIVGRLICRVVWIKVRLGWPVEGER